jgi:hypothetical protein
MEDKRLGKGNRIMEVIHVVLIVIERLRAELEHHIGKEDPDFCKYALSQLEIMEWAIKSSNGHNKGSIH